MKKHIIIIGGGFAGINLISKLSNDDNFEITLVDKNNYSFFPPLIYQVSASILEPSAVSFPFRRFIKNKKNIHFRMDELIKIIPEENKIILKNGELQYDFLVLATGTKTNYFGMENMEKYSYPMKTLNDALQLRNIILDRFEQASRESDEQIKKRLLSFVITGGGPAGVEISGVLKEITNSIVHEEYKELKDIIDVYIIEGSPNLLNAMSKDSHRESYEALSKLGVKIYLNTRVTNCDEHNIYFGNNQKIETNLIIWTAGVVSRTFDGLPDSIYGRGKRIKVDAHNKVENFNNIFAIGDTCIMENADENFKEGHPQLAQVAIQQAKFLALNLKNNANEKPLVPFVYNDMGSMAVIGKNKAVSELTRPKLFLKGFLAWLVWSSIHIMSLVSFGNKINTFYRWFTTYLFNSTGLRINYKTQGDK